MRNRSSNPIAVVTLSFVLIITMTSAAVANGQFSEWSEPKNLGAVVNSSVFDVGAFISKDGLSLYFGSARTGGFGGLDIYVCQRTSLEAPWSVPRNLGPEINSASNDQAPSLSSDEHRLYFQSDRTGGFGLSDLYVSRRHNRRDDFGWQQPANLGGDLNTSANEAAPASPAEGDDTGAITLYFTSDRPGFGGDDIYSSTLQEDDTFGPATLVEELSTAFQDRQPFVRRDGLEMFFTSDRPGSWGGTDLWVTTRIGSGPWSVPANVGSIVNGSANDGRPALSFDGTQLYFQSTRPGGVGGQDLYVASRTKLNERHEGNALLPGRRP
jgi:hypothetical protein